LITPSSAEILVGVGNWNKREENLKNNRFYILSQEWENSGDNRKLEENRGNLDSKYVRGDKNKVKKETLVKLDTEN